MPELAGGRLCGRLAGVRTKKKTHTEPKPKDPAFSTTRSSRENLKAKLGSRKILGLHASMLVGRVPDLYLATFHRASAPFMLQVVSRPNSCLERGSNHRHPDPTTSAADGVNRPWLVGPLLAAWNRCKRLVQKAHRVLLVRDVVHPLETTSLPFPATGVQLLKQVLGPTLVTKTCRMCLVQSLGKAGIPVLLRSREVSSVLPPIPWLEQSIFK